ncbi:MAG: PAS domain S-box protein, partial [Verrucomicrobiae bacterium]|nr:PAS domain S-box protein [Verrucomicrobiae bacterium]
MHQLREQLSSFNQAMAQCPSSIIITDLDGNIEYVNSQFSRLSGYEMEEVIGRNPRILKSGNMEPEVYKDLWDTITQGEVWRGDLENRNKNGRIFWEHTSISPIKDKEGRVIRYFAVKEDITEARLKSDEARNARLEAEAAKAADHAKAVFLKLIGQEIKNPINRLLGFTNLVSQTSLTIDQLNQINQIGGAGLELLTLINRILDFTSAETGTMELDFGPFNPRETVDRVLAVYEQKASEKGIVMRKLIQESIPEKVIGDERRFREVIHPLLDNAIKATFVGSVSFNLSAKFNQENKIWEFQGEVADTGRGIPEEKLESLFKPFAQIESGLGEGVGLGLALCQRLCILQGGSLSATSEVGKGSIFAFNLRFQLSGQEDPVLQVAHMPEGKDFAREYPLNILIAEDNRINRRLLETLMDRLGYQATFALDGTSVLSEVRKKAYELIFMDLEMPI